MKNKLFICLTAMLMIVSASVNAQVLDRVGDRVKQRTQQRTDAKVDETVDKVLHRVFGGRGNKGNNETQPQEEDETEGNNPYSNRTEGNGSGVNIGGLLSKRIGNDCEPKASYTFQSDVTMKYTAVEGKKNGEQVEMDMRMHYTNDMSAMAIVYLENTMGLEPESSMIVVDMLDSFTVMRMNVAGQNINTCTDNRESLASNAEEFDAESMGDWKKTGKTKTVLGYLCEEYVQEYDGNSNEIWVTDELDNFMIGAGATGQSPMSNISLPDNVPTGYPLETTLTAKDGSKTIITTIEINKNNTTTIRMN
jgi:hypothetical protein